jgi:tRNA (mo5U34)-methyltransferase
VSDTGQEWDQQRIAERIASFDRWHYEFDLRGQVTPVIAPQIANRHDQRARHFFDPLVEELGGSLAGRRVLDLGCNAGFWALKAIDAGADFVWGIDGRDVNVEQARFVFAVKDVDPSRYRFTAADLYEVDLREEPPFDVVLCLGLLYHVSKPMELLERAAAVNTELLLVDTLLVPAEGACLELWHEPLDDPRMAVDRSLVMRPSRRAVIAMTTALGYEVGVLEPRFDDYTGAGDYKGGVRRAFACSRGRPLEKSAFRLEEPPFRPDWVVSELPGAGSRMAPPQPDRRAG